MAILKIKDALGVWHQIQTIRGQKGDTGDTGAPGAGVAAGGTTGQVLKKRSAADYDTEWGEGGSQDIFFCTTSTTAAEITAALTAGKLPVLVYGTGRFVYTNTATGGNYYFFSRCQDNVTTTISIYIPDSTWSVPGTATMAYASTVNNHIGDTTAHVTAADKTAWSGKQDAIADLSDIRSGAALGATAVQPAAISDMASKTWVGQQGYLTQHQSLSGYATQSWVNSQGFLTQHQSISGKEDKGKLTVGGTQYTVRTGTAGAAGYITLVVE